MPVYADGQATLLKSNSQGFMFKAEAKAITSGKASVAFQLERIKSAFYPWGASFEVAFSADPGAFQLDIQTADTDKDSNYVTINSINGGLNASFVGRIELPNFWARYVRGKVVTLTNSVNTTLLVTR